MRRGTALGFALALATVLGGCADPSQPAAAPTHPSPSHSNATLEPPVADFYPNANPVLPNQTVRFDASKSMDPAGGNLTFEWDFGDGARAEGTLAHHAYAQPGTYPVRLKAHSDRTGLNGTASLGLLVLDPATLKRPLVLADAAGDAHHEWSDLVAVSLSESGGYVTVEFVLADLGPLVAYEGPVLLDVALGDNPFEVYGFAGGLRVWDFARQIDVPGAQVELDPEGNAVRATMAWADIGPRPPFKVHAESRLGEAKLVHGQATDDRAPDQGEAPYPP